MPISANTKLNIKATKLSNREEQREEKSKKTIVMINSFLLTQTLYRWSGRSEGRTLRS